MIRISVDLPDIDHMVLKVAAARQQTTISDLIREAIAPLISANRRHISDATVGMTILGNIRRQRGESE